MVQSPAGLLNMGNKKIFFSKKGSGFLLGKKPIYFIIVAFFLFIVFILFSYLVLSNISSTTTFPENIETTVLINRFLNSPECFAYQDEETGRTYTGITDLDKFNNENLNECYSADEDSPRAFMMDLNSDDYQKSVLTSNWRAKKINRMSQYVIIYDKGNFYGGTLLIAVQE